MQGCQSRSTHAPRTCRLQVSDHPARTRVHLDAVAGRPPLAWGNCTSLDGNDDLRACPFTPLFIEPSTTRPPNMDSNAGTALTTTPLMAQRKRKPASCELCRQKKYGSLTGITKVADLCGRLRCDRALPACTSCVRRGDIASCSYQDRRPGTQRHWPSSHTSSGSAHARIDQLETLLRQMVENRGDVDLAAGRTATPQSCNANDRDLEGQNSNGETANGLDGRVGGCQPPCQIQDDSRRDLGVGEARWDALLAEVGREERVTVSTTYDSDSSRRLGHICKGKAKTTKSRASVSNES
jgi:hypothetical protein